MPQIMDGEREEKARFVFTMFDEGIVVLVVGMMSTWHSFVHLLQMGVARWI